MAQPDAHSTQSEADNTERWTFGLFNCFDDFGLCIATFLLPCYTIGRNAEALGEDGFKVGVLYCLGLTPLAAVMRWRIRQKQQISGDMLVDTAISCLLPCCALIQENRQLYGASGSHVGEKLPLNTEMQRQ